MSQCAPRCFCGWPLAPCEDGFRCPRCRRIYDSTATLPACKHSKTTWVEGDRTLYRVECVTCGATWSEVPISEVRTHD